MSDEQEVGAEAALAEDDERGFDAVLDFLQRSHGFDFTVYKRTSLARRVRRRMHAIGIESLSAYRSHLEIHPEELPQLFDSLLINVTAFYRDPAVWNALASRLSTIADPRGDAPVRIWSAGCSSGEEPYTLAMVTAEVFGIEGLSRRVKIYATDVDEDALAEARDATYPPSALEAVPPALVEKYFVRVGTGFVVHKDLRRAVIFGRHDLVQDAPIPCVDVLTCRNTLMYFNAAAQTRIIHRLQAALRPSGLLVLGKAEMLLSYGDVFAPVDLKLRLFSRVPVMRGRDDRRAVHRDSTDPKAKRTDDEVLAMEPASREARRPIAVVGAELHVREVIFDLGPTPQIMLDPSGRIARANQKAVQLFELTPKDTGRSFREIARSFRGDALRSIVDEVRLEKRHVQLLAVERAVTSGEKTFFDIEAVPLWAPTMDALRGVMVSFVDVTRLQWLQAELHRVKSELASAHEALWSRTKELAAVHESLSSSVMVLESTCKELEATNEQLRQPGAELTNADALFYGATLAEVPPSILIRDRDPHMEAGEGEMGNVPASSGDACAGGHSFKLDFGVPQDNKSGVLRVDCRNQEDSGRVLESIDSRGDSLKRDVDVVPVHGELAKSRIVIVEEVG